jgi:hypothetical protein
MKNVIYIYDKLYNRLSRFLFTTHFAFFPSPRTTTMKKKEDRGKELDRNLDGGIWAG